MSKRNIILICMCLLIVVVASVVIKKSEEEKRIKKDEVLREYALIKPMDSGYGFSLSGVRTVADEGRVSGRLIIIPSEPENEIMDYYRQELCKNGWIEVSKANFLKDGRRAELSFDKATSFEGHERMIFLIKIESRGKI